jgi:hypothetical protein
MQKPLLKITISGPGVTSGRITIPVLLSICQEAQAAVDRQAGAIEMKISGKPAPESTIRECTLELIALTKKGSTTLDFAPASKQTFLLPEMASVGIEAVSAVAETLQDVNKKRGKWNPPDPAVLDALDDLGSVFEQGVDKLKWIIPSQDRRHKRRTAEFVPATLRKVRQRKQEALPLASPPASVVPLPADTITALPTPVQESFLEGMLEPADGKVRIRPPFGPPTILNFGADKAENVFEAMHKPVRVKVDAKAPHKLVDLEITAPNFPGSASFFNHKTIDQLIAEQGVQPIADLEALGGLIPDEDLDEFIADIYRDREA